MWWLKPRYVVLLLAIPTLVGAYLTPEDAYLVLYETRKYVDLGFLLLGLLLYAAFFVGSLFAVGGTRPQERILISYCRTFVWPLFTLTMTGYLVWFASAALRAGGPIALLGAFSRVLFTDDPGFSDYVKFEIFATLPGFTTLTQLGILYATVEALLWVRGRSARHTALMRAATVGSFTLSRAIFLSERVALIEVAVPVIVVFAAAVGFGGLRGRLVKFAPVFLVPMVFALFAIGEYFRSWKFYDALYDGTYLQFAAQRLLGYYTTAVNNAALLYYQEPLHPLRHTLASLFEFPGLGGVVGEAYGNLFGGTFDQESYAALLERFANPEFNNISLIGLLLNEYSVFLAPVAAFVLGVIAASFYGSFVNGRVVGLLIYPSWFIGVLEISRVYSWTAGRYFPVLAFLVLSLLLFKLVQRNPQAWKKAPPVSRLVLELRANRTRGVSRRVR